jgi:hypothetical protein
MTIDTINPSLVEIRQFLLNAHYHLMDNSRFFYDKGIIDASRIFCSLASDINIELRKEKV